MMQARPAQHPGEDGISATAASTVIHQLFRPFDDIVDEPADLSDETEESLATVDGVNGVTAIRFQPPDGAGDQAPQPTYFVSCNGLADAPALGQCPDGADVVEIVPNFAGGILDKPMSETTWPASAMGQAELSNLPVATIVVSTDGSPRGSSTPAPCSPRHTHRFSPPLTITEYRAENTRTVDNIHQLANVVLIASLVIAGCSLAVNTVGGLAERRRPFSLLRLTGVPLAKLRRVVILETANPLFLGVLISAAAGLATAAMVLHGQLDQPLQPPTASFYLMIVGGVVVSISIIASTLPLLARLTGPETSRTE